MLDAPDEEASTPASAPRDDADERIRTLSERVECLQTEVAMLRARHLCAEARDAGMGSLLSERAASFSEIERLANVGSWSWDVQTDEVCWSEQAFRIFGYDPHADRATRDAFFAALHPEDREVLSNVSARIAAGVTPSASRCRFIHANGSARHVILTGTPIRDQTGQLIRVVGAALDVTEFVAVESELRRTAQLLNEAERMAGLDPPHRVDGHPVSHLRDRTRHHRHRRAIFRPHPSRGSRTRARLWRMLARRAATFLRIPRGLAGRQLAPRQHGGEARP
jgi:PAS domain S-box-containing protein